MAVNEGKNNLNSKADTLELRGFHLTCSLGNSKTVSPCRQHRIAASNKTSFNEKFQIGSKCVAGIVIISH